MNNTQHTNIQQRQHTTKITHNTKKLTQKSQHNKDNIEGTERLGIEKWIFVVGEHASAPPFWVIHSLWFFLLYFFFCLLSSFFCLLSFFFLYASLVLLLSFHALSLIRSFFSFFFSFQFFLISFKGLRADVCHTFLLLPVCLHHCRLYTNLMFIIFLAQFLSLFCLLSFSGFLFSFFLFSRCFFRNFCFFPPFLFRLRLSSPLPLSSLLFSTGILRIMSEFISTIESCCGKGWPTPLFKKCTQVFFLFFLLFLFAV